MNGLVVQYQDIQKELIVIPGEILKIELDELPRSIFVIGIYFKDAQISYQLEQSGEFPVVYVMNTSKEDIRVNGYRIVYAEV